jgi:hypothetical protein
MVSSQFRKMKTNQHSFLIIKVASSELRQDENRFHGMTGVSANLCRKKPFLGCLASLLAAGVFTFVSPMQAKGPSGDGNPRFNPFWSPLSHDRASFAEFVGPEEL